MPRPNLTIGECIDNRYTVTIWCGSCPGRDLDLNLVAAKWADRRLVTLAERGAFTCLRCKGTATFVSVSAHLVAETIFAWSARDGLRS